MRAPFPGQSRPVTDAPDPVFARGLVGAGVALEPRGGRQRAVAPISGRLVKLLRHAYVVQSEDGYGVLVHLGMDTVQLNGEGFELLAAEDQQVRAGDDIVSWDPDVVVRRGRSSLSCVVALGCPPDRVVVRSLDAEVEVQQTIFELE